MKKLLTLIMVAGLVLWACQSESTEEPVGSEEGKTKTESVEQGQPQQTQQEESAIEAESAVTSANYEWNKLVEEYNQLWCKYSNKNTPADEKEKIYPRLKELQEELDKIYAEVKDPQEKQALYQAMAKMVECK